MKNKNSWKYFIVMKGKIPNFLILEKMYKCKNIVFVFSNLSLAWNPLSLLLSHWWCKISIAQQPKSSAKPETEITETLQGCLPREIKSRKLKPFKKKKPQGPAAICKPSPSGEARHSQVLGAQYQIRSHQRLHKPRRAKTQPGVDASFFHESLGTCNMWNKKTKTKQNFIEQLLNYLTLVRELED